MWQHHIHTATKANVYFLRVSNKQYPAHTHTYTRQRYSIFAHRIIIEHTDTEKKRERESVEHTRIDDDNEIYGAIWNPQRAKQSTNNGDCSVKPKNERRNEQIMKCLSHSLSRWRGKICALTVNTCWGFLFFFSVPCCWYHHAVIQ